MPNEVQPFIDPAKLKLGTTASATFRYISEFLFAVSWIVALPAELVLNRRMGRRYTGFLPVAASFILVTFWFGALNFLLAAGSKTPRTPSFMDLGALWLAQSVFLLALFRHRLASWWRLRTVDQVHSLSCGVPFWLNPPRWIVDKFSKPRASEAPDPTTAWDQAIPADAKGLTLIIGVSRAFLAHVVRQVPPFIAVWKSGQVPTGPFMWFMATVVHPVALLLLCLPLSVVSGSLALYVMAASLAMLVKARLDKAFVVEKVYDLFDARIEQRFAAALGDTKSLNAIERTGLVVPGVARMAATSASVMQSPTSLAPELAKLIDAKLPQVAIEVRPQAIANGTSVDPTAAPER